MQNDLRKDLQDLQNLPRQPLLSYMQKQSQPTAPRPKTADIAPTQYPLLAAFDTTKLFKWIGPYLSQRLGPRHPFLTYATSGTDQGVYRMPGGSTEVRLALAGDWATGTDEAHGISELMAGYAPHYSIHLGDVYYVGGPEEVAENFLGIKNPLNHFEPCSWPKGSLGSFALNGNHEMYARGFSYFDQMLPALGLIENGRSVGQKGSFFCLENDHWRIIALDTGYNSIDWPIIEYFRTPPCALRPEQIAWLRDVVRPRADDPRGIILLTHHQYYSRYEDWYPLPAKQLSEFFSRPVLWYWGHEHRMTVYEEFEVPGAGIRAIGRCIGHGGMPVDLPPAKPMHEECAVEFVDTRPYPNDEHLTIGYNGYARMTLNDDRVTVEYEDVLGAIIFTEIWQVDSGGNLQRIRETPSVAASAATPAS